MVDLRDLGRSCPAGCTGASGGLVGTMKVMLPECTRSSASETTSARYPRSPFATHVGTDIAFELISVGMTWRVVYDGPWASSATTGVRVAMGKQEVTLVVFVMVLITM